MKTALHGSMLSLLALAASACASAAPAASENLSHETSEALTATGSGVALAWLTGDINGDHKTDIIVPVDNGDGSLGLHLYPSNGAAYTVGSSVKMLGLSADALAWLTGDVNGDGKTDIIQPYAKGGRLGIRVFQSNGTSYTPTWYTDNIGQGADALAWLTGDVNGDGKTDIIQPWSNNGRLGMIVYLSDGAGYASSFGTADIGQTSGALAWLTGDVNGDGKTDIIQPTSNGGVLGLNVYEWNGSAYASTFANTNMGQGSRALAWLTGDVNGDGKTDILQPFDNGTRLGLITYQSNGPGYVVSSGVADMGEGSVALAWLAGDINGTKRVGLMQPFSNGTRLGLIDYASNGSGLSVAWGTTDIGQGAAALAWLTGDVNGDGKTDLIQPWSNGDKLGMLVYQSTGAGHAFTWGTSDLGPNPNEPPRAPSKPGLFSVTPNVTSVAVGWESPDATMDQFVVYRRDAQGSWQPVYTQTMNTPQKTYAWVDTDRSLSAQCYRVTALNTKSGLGSSTDESCTVRPDPSVFPQSAPTDATAWYGLSSQNDGVSTFESGELFLQKQDQTWGVNLGLGHDTGNNVKAERRGGGDSTWPLMKGEALAIRVWGAGWLAHGHQTWGVDLVLSDTPSYEWYVIGEGGQPGQSLGDGEMALYNKDADDFLVRADHTWGVNLNWYKKTLPSEGGGGGGGGGGTPKGVSEVDLYNCIPEARPLAMWVLDQSVPQSSWVQHGTADSAWVVNTCPTQAGPMWTFAPPVSGHSYVIRAVDFMAKDCTNDPTIGMCTHFATSVVADSKGPPIGFTAQ